MTNENAARVLTGTTREVYYFLVKVSNPVGVREIQRALNLSSVSVVAYHLDKLEEAGLVKQKEGGYTVAKVILKDNVRISHFLIPRYFFYTVFTALILIIELAFFRPEVIDRSYFLYTLATATVFLIFCFETIKKWLDNST